MLKPLILCSLLSLVGSEALGVNDYSSRAEELVVNRDIVKEAEAIKSMEQVKKTLRQLIANIDKCGTGSCHNSASLSVCDYIALVDIRLNGKLGLGMTYSDRSPGFPVTEKDVSLLKRIANSCKLTSYQYWNSPLLTHVGYAPSQEDSEWINEELQLD